jgi:hypothetical protein
MRRRLIFRVYAHPHQRGAEKDNSDHPKSRSNNSMSSHRPFLLRYRSQLTDHIATAWRPPVLTFDRQSWHFSRISPPMQDSELCYHSPATIKAAVQSAAGTAGLIEGEI